jgi:hypothetical protein
MDFHLLHVASWRNKLGDEATSLEMAKETSERPMLTTVTCEKRSYAHNGNSSLEGRILLRMKIERTTSHDKNNYSSSFLPAPQS